MRPLDGVTVIALEQAVAAPLATRQLAGLGAESLLPRYPRLIVCDVSGYGDNGPCGSKKAYDLLVQAEAGVLSVTGTADTPSKVGISIADIATGMYAYSGILTALYQREKSGKGTRIEVTMLEALTEWMGYPLYYTHFGGTAPARSGPNHATIVPYGRYKSGDGKSIMLGLQNEREWAVFCEKVLLQPELAQDPRYGSNSRRAAKRSEINALIAKDFATLTTKQLIERLDASGIANALINTPNEVW